jgi:hypothetical protein
MSQIAMTIIDSKGAVHGKPHGSFTHRAVGALAAEPETIAEFEVALDRFGDDDWKDPLAGWCSGVCEEPYDAGICIIDLPARMIFLESTYSCGGPSGTVLCRFDSKEYPVSYHLSEDWRFSQNIPGWQAEADAGRRRRLAEPPVDTRPVLYREICRFLLDECIAARNETCSDQWLPPTGWTLRILPDRARPNEPPTAEDAVAEIHARWLMTPRADLGDRSPRQVLLARREHLGFDLQDRCEQWSRGGECPLPLSRESAAYRYAGFGTHEIVINYEMVRLLAWECWERVVEAQGANPQGSAEKENEIRHLERTEQDWLNSPNLEDFSGKTPALVIENERRRIPWAVSGKEAMVDDDCPLCQMMAESMGLGFWHLDGCNMDFDFPFSWHSTREAWAEEQRDWADFNHRFEEEMRRKEGGPDAADCLGRNKDTSPWHQSGSNTDPRVDPPAIAMFGLACHVAELEENLKAFSATAGLVGSVNRHFGNLREAIDHPSPELIEPVVGRLCDQLQAVCEAQPDLSDKCIDLQREMQEFAARFSEESVPDDELPF